MGACIIHVLRYYARPRSGSAITSRIYVDFRSACMRVGRSDLIDFPTERTAMDGEGAGLEEAAAQTAKDEQISLLKTVVSASLSYTDII